jgi:hypothetical protein
METDMLNLHHVAKIAMRIGHNPLDGIRALRKLRANPIKPTADLFSSFFDCATKSTRRCDVISMGPERLEGFRPSVLEFELCGVNLGQHCLKLFTY